MKCPANFEDNKYRIKAKRSGFDSEKEKGANTAQLSPQDGNGTVFAPSDVVEQNTQNPNSKSSDLYNMVEARGVEPLSESVLTATSPGADDYLHSLAPS